MIYILTILKGLLIGLCFPIPGISGSTMAVILKVYDPIIEFLSLNKGKVKKHILTILCLGIGGLIGGFLFSTLLNNLANTHPVPLGFAFMGLIIGGIPFIYKETNVKKIKVTDILFILLGLAIVVGLFFIKTISNEVYEETSFLLSLRLFFSGLVGCIAMIIPGISGSFTLMILGIYDTVINAVSTFNFAIIIPTLIGGIIGIIIGSKLINLLLKKYRKPTYLVILGLTLGSLFIIFNNYCLTFLFNLEGIIAIILLIGLATLSYCFSKIKKD